MGVAEVARIERAGRGLMGLIRLWKGVEKSKGPSFAELSSKGIAAKH